MLLLLIAATVRNQNFHFSFLELDFNNTSFLGKVWKYFIVLPVWTKRLQYLYQLHIHFVGYKVRKHKVADLY